MKGIPIGFRVNKLHFFKHILKCEEVKFQNDNFFQTSKFNILLLAVDKSNTKFTNHFISQNKILWNVTTLDSSIKNSLEDCLSSEMKEIYLYVYSENTENIYFLGRLLKHDIVKSGMYIKESPYFLSGIVISIPNKLTHKMWFNLGWDVLKLCRINNLLVPKLLLEVVCEGDVFSDKKEVYQFVRFSSIYGIRSITNYLENLLRDSPQMFSSGLIKGEFLGIASILDDDFILLNYNVEAIEPTVETFFSKKIIADNFESFMNILNNGNMKNYI